MEAAEVLLNCCSGMWAEEAAAQVQGSLKVTTSEEVKLGSGGRRQGRAFGIGQVLLFKEEDVGRWRSRLECFLG
jgi:hypothetical protein